MKDKKIVIAIAVTLALALLVIAVMFAVENQLNAYEDLPEEVKEISAQPLAADICWHKWENGVCTECGEVCEHKTWAEGVCTVCGDECGHPSWVDGVCPVCGYACPHPEWDNGSCAACGTVCAHSEHDPETIDCKVCGLKVWHDFTNNGICECGKDIELRTAELPAFFIQEPEEQGTVNYYEYETRNHRKDSTWTQTKKICVYLPYGYDESKQYDTILLLHGDGGGNEKSWLDAAFKYGETQTYTKGRYVLDNMIAGHYCKPVIVVAIFFAGDDINFQADEIKYDVMPFVARNFSTYAGHPSEDTTEAYVQAITDEREHFAIAGLSHGAIRATASGWKEDYQIFANYGIFSGFSLQEQIAKKYSEGEMDSYPLKCFYASGGARDSMRDDAWNGYLYLTNNVEAIVPGENAYYTTIEGAGHDYTTWFTSLYNALRLFF